MKLNDFLCTKFDLWGRLWGGVQREMKCRKSRRIPRRQASSRRGRAASFAGASVRLGVSRSSSRGRAGRAHGFPAPVGGLSGAPVTACDGRRWPWLTGAAHQAAPAREMAWPCAGSSMKIAVGMVLAAAMMALVVPGDGAEVGVAAEAGSGRAAAFPLRERLRVCASPLPATGGGKGFRNAESTSQGRRPPAFSPGGGTAEPAIFLPLIFLPLKHWHVLRCRMSR